MQEDKIDLMELFAYIWSRKHLLIKIIACSIIFGIFIAFTSKVEFEASCKLIPENQEGAQSNLGGLGSLAGLAGINLEMNETGRLSPLLYPEIVQSMPFQLSLIKKEVRFEKLDTTLSSYDYFKNHDSPSLIGVIIDYTFGLPAKLKKLFVDNKEQANTNKLGFIRLSKEDYKLIDRFSDRIRITISDETGIVHIRTEFPDPTASAMITDLVVKMLTNEVTDYKTERAQINLSFIKERYEDAQGNYNVAQRNMANFADRNRNLTSSLIQVEHDRLQNELNIAFEVFKGLATQLEQAKIKLKEDTPVFTVLEPVRIPEDKLKPKRLLIILGFCIGSFFICGTWLAISYVLVKRNNI